MSDNDFLGFKPSTGISEINETRKAALARLRSHDPTLDNPPVNSHTVGNGPNLEPVIPLYDQSNDVELWPFLEDDPGGDLFGDIVPISPNRSHASSNQLSDLDISGYVNEVLDGMDRNIRMVESLISSSFSGFSEGSRTCQRLSLDQDDSPDSVLLPSKVEEQFLGWSDQLESVDNRVARLRQIIAEGNLVPQSPASQIPDNVSSLPNAGAVARSPVATRSRGPVPEYPLVQRRILEYHTLGVPVSESEEEISLT